MACLSSSETLIVTTLVLWRISLNEALDGIGAIRGGGRWNTPGHAVVYLAETAAGAMLEILAHLPLEEADLPEQYKLLRVEAGTGAPVETLNVSATWWQANPGVTQRIGDAWLESATAVLARVPSAIMPYTWNYLLNPLHADSAKARVVQASEHLYDPRLLRVRKS